MEFLAGWTLGVMVSAGCAFVIWCAAITRQRMRDRRIKRSDLPINAISGAEPTALEK
jgi:hypothetical protein